MNDLMRQAATGNNDAMDALCDAALERAQDETRDRGFALAEALVFARLAATDYSQGRVGRLLSIMALVGDELALCDMPDEAARLLTCQQLWPSGRLKPRPFAASWSVDGLAQTRSAAGGTQGPHTH